MIELSSGLNYGDKDFLELVGKTNLQKRPQLPRHISSLESETYNRSNLTKIQTLSACPLSQDLSSSKVAWDILKYQLGDRPVRQKHSANLRRNLEHRLLVARVQGNERLVQILQEESLQLQNS